MLVQTFNQVVNYMATAGWGQQKSKTQIKKETQIKKKNANKITERKQKNKTQIENANKKKQNAEGGHLNSISFNIFRILIVMISRAESLFHAP